MRDKIELFYKSAGIMVNYYWNLDVKFYNLKECKTVITDVFICDPDVLRKTLKELYNKYHDKIVIGNNEFTKAMKNVLNIKFKPISVKQFQDNYSFTYFNYCLYGDRSSLETESNNKRI